MSPKKTSIETVQFLGPAKLAARGSTLIVVLVGLIICGAIGYIVMSTLVGSTQRMASVIEAADLRDLRAYLSSATDCAKTKKIYCVPPKNVGLLVDRDGAEIVAPSDGSLTKFGKRYTVKADCSKAPQANVQVKVGSGPWKPLYTPATPFSCAF